MVLGFHASTFFCGVRAYRNDRVCAGSLQTLNPKP